MNALKLRMIARAMMALGSLAVIVGGFTIFEGGITIGDALMIGGMLALVAGTFLLARTPPGNIDLTDTQNEGTSDAG